MRYHLQSLLDAKERQLQQAGALGQRVLAQQMELEERIRQLQEIDADSPDDDPVDEDARERYRELAETLMAWNSENADLSSGFGARVRATVVCQYILLFHFVAETPVPATRVVVITPRTEHQCPHPRRQLQHRCRPVPPRTERRPSRRRRRYVRLAHR
jgi:hypothetical protein